MRSCGVAVDCDAAFSQRSPHALHPCSMQHPPFNSSLERDGNLNDVRPAGYCRASVPAGHGELATNRLSIVILLIIANWHPFRRIHTIPRLHRTTPPRLSTVAASNLYAYARIGSGIQWFPGTRPGQRYVSASPWTPLHHSCPTIQAARPYMRFSRFFPLGWRSTHLYELLLPPQYST